MTLLASGPQPVLKRGSTGSAVRRVQRALNAATSGTGLSVTGIFSERTDRTLRAWQKTTGIAREGVANPKTWAALAAGERS